MLGLTEGVESLSVASLFRPGAATEDMPVR